VFALDSIDHWKDVGKGLREIKRILRSGGFLVIVKDQNVSGTSKAINKLKNTLESAGYEILEIVDIVKEEISFLLLICSI
jgi:hypothetical protein